MSEVTGYRPQNPYYSQDAGFGAGSVESEAEKGDRLQIEKMKLQNKATYQNNYTAYLQKLS
ncbi:MULTISPECIES: hypothetical protein [Pseudomonas]|uniref:Uncharacterized protein n=1 Tax=Pseudomonas reactans TaxID=117680 RepID=A0A7Y8G0M0_9PSED|nr:hypothetical protein [Pseudomonas reactans]NWE89042.1 hypothetical protein [Pseudomonas reactans]